MKQGFYSYDHMDLGVDVYFTRKWGFYLESSNFLEWWD